MTQREEKAKYRREKQMRYQEACIQSQLVSWFSLQYPKLAPLLIHIPNGVASSPKTGARLKSMGQKSGIPDLMLCYPKCKSHGLFLEMKCKTGKVSKNQRMYLDLLESQNYTCKVAYGFIEASHILEHYVCYGE